MMGAQDYTEGMLIFWGLALVLLVLLVALIRSLRIIFAQPSGRGERAKKVAKISVRRMAVAVVLGVTANYLMDAHLRSKAHDCQKAISDMGGKYVGELCALGGDDYVGRVYDAKSKELLGERTFNTQESDLSWFRGQVSFMRGGDDSDVIELPPTWLDRLRAKLP